MNRTLTALLVTTLFTPLALAETAEERMDRHREEILDRLYDRAPRAERDPCEVAAEKQSYTGSDGTVYVRSGGGLVNTRTGEFLH